MADYFADLDKAVEEESSAGGGIIALTRVDVGYKVYANNAQLSENSPAGKTPYTQGMTFFPTGPDKGSREKALDAAKKFAMAVGAKPPNGLSVQMICSRRAHSRRVCPSRGRTTGISSRRCGRTRKAVRCRTAQRLSSPR